MIYTSNEKELFFLNMYHSYKYYKGSSVFKILQIFGALKIILETNK